MEILFVLLVTVVMVILIVLLFPSGSKSDVRARLAALESGTEFQPVSAIDEERSKPFVDRVIRPFLANLAGQRDPKQMKKSQQTELRKLLAQAGFPGGLTVAEFGVIINLARIILPLVALALAVLLGMRADQMVLAGAVGGVAGMIGPKVFLQRKVAARLHKIQRQLPDVLDLLTVAVEAGLGFDAACDKVVEKMKGPIPDEFSLMLRQVRMGQARRDAMKDMAERVDHPDMSAFMSALIQADQLGVSIGQVLRVQSDTLREKRRQRAEEEANKAPVKMMIPLVFFIFPNVGIVIGAPAAFQIIEQMSQLN